MRLNIFIFIIISNLINGQAIEWISFEQAIKAQKENPKKKNGLTQEDLIL